MGGGSACGIVRRMKFTKATKTQAKLRMAIQGPSGAGKTRSALEIARHMGSRVAVIDSEHGSASKYAGAGGLDFDVCEVTDDYHPEKLIKLLGEAGKEYDVLIVDSMTHWWNGPGGFLELVDREVERMKARGAKPDSFAAWKVVDPVYKRLVQAILSCQAHVIVTMRAKQSFEKDVENGRTVIRKVGLAPEMRDNFQYEADVEGMIDIDHKLVIGKTRCDAIDGKIYHKPGKELAQVLMAWLSDGAPSAEKPADAAVNWDDKLEEGLRFIAEAPAEMADSLTAYLSENFPKGKAPDAVRKKLAAAMVAKGKGS